MTLRVEVGKKGYVIIPKSVRELVGIKEGDVLTVRVDDGKIILEPERKVDLKALREAMEEHKKRISYAKKANLGDLANVSLEEEFM